MLSAIFVSFSLIYSFFSFLFFVFIDTFILLYLFENAKLLSLSIAGGCFGFILGIAPGGISFEKAPFKLTKEYVELMGGKDSLYYQMYGVMIILGMIELLTHKKVFCLFL